MRKTSKSGMKQQLTKKLSLRSWVMLDDSNPQTFVNLPGERALYSSPARTSFSLTTSNSLPSTTPIKLSSSSGVVHLTNQRVRICPSHGLPTEPQHADILDYDRSSTSPPNAQRNSNLSPAPSTIFTTRTSLPRSLVQTSGPPSCNPSPMVASPL